MKRHIELPLVGRSMLDLCAPKMSDFAFEERHPRAHNFGIQMVVGRRGRAAQTNERCTLVVVDLLARSMRCVERDAIQHSAKRDRDGKARCALTARKINVSCKIVRHES